MAGPPPPITTSGLSMGSDGSIWQYAPLEPGQMVELWGGPGSENFALGPATGFGPGDALPAGWWIVILEDDPGAAQLIMSNGSLTAPSQLTGYTLSVV